MSPNEPSNANELSVAQCSIAATRRRRFHWAVWWKTSLKRHPFARPDAHGGGARTYEIALADATAAVGRSVTMIEPQWARAWARVMQGQSPWPRTGSRGKNAQDGQTAGATASVTPWSPSTPWWKVLGVERSATLVETRRAYRKLVLIHHPDRGGVDAMFRRIDAAYRSACRAHERRA